MKNLNCLTLSGRLGRDFDLRHTPSGTAVTENALAVATGYGDKEGTAWVPLVFWGKLAESASQYLGKGRECLIKGRLEQETWTDKENKQQVRLKCVVEDWGFIGPKPDGAAAAPAKPSQAPAKPAPAYEPEQEDDEIPF